MKPEDADRLIERGRDAVANRVMGRDLIASLCDLAEKRGEALRVAMEALDAIRQEAKSPFASFFRTKANGALQDCGRILGEGEGE